MKTAITQLKDRLLEIGFTGVEPFIYEYLETEKQQIIEARVNGVAKSLSMDESIVDRNASALYYEQTFNNQ